MLDSTSGQLVLIGGGEHARVVSEIAMLNEVPVRGYVAPEMSSGIRHPYLGDDEKLVDHNDCFWTLAVGATRLTRSRKSVVEGIGTPARGFSTLIHPTAVISTTAEIEEGTVIGAGAIVQGGARIGKHVIVGASTVVEHDVEIGDFVVLGPSVTIGGGTKIGADSFVGMGAAIRDHVDLGPEVTIGMGSVVIRSQPARATYLGANVPSKKPNKQ